MKWVNWPEPQEFTCVKCGRKYYISTQSKSIKDEPLTFKWVKALPVILKQKIYGKWRWV